MERTIGFQRTYSIRSKWLKLSLRLPVISSQQTVRDHERFLKEWAAPGSTFEPAYAKGGTELFREVEHGRMAYIGSVADDTKKRSRSRAIVAAGLGKAARQ